MESALILGGGHSLWDDLAQVDAETFDTVIAVNDAGAAYRGRIDYWCSLHPEKLPKWMARRKGNEDYETVCHKARRQSRVDHVVQEVWSGSSGLYAVQFAILKLDARNVVLCGVPMTPTGHFFDNTAWKYAERYRRGWKAALPTIQGRVTSLSGWSRDLLGAPANLRNAQPLT